jgi:hypothetical protein
VSPTSKEKIGSLQRRLGRRQVVLKQVTVARAAAGLLSFNSIHQDLQY